MGGAKGSLDDGEETDGEGNSHFMLLYAIS